MKLAAVALALVLCAGCAGESLMRLSEVPEGVEYVETGRFDKSSGEELVLVSDLDLPGMGPSPGSWAREVWNATEPFIPDGPWKGLGVLSLYFMAKLGSKRYREGVGRAIKQAGSLNLGGALRGLAAAEGVMHMHEDPSTLKAVAERKIAMEKAEATAPKPT
ncbi:MAG TPA: hypothetical protein VF653_01310 [Methylomirabilota bacterium]